MARAHHNSSSSEPVVGNIQAEASRAFPANVGTCGSPSSPPMCEQYLPQSPAPQPQSPAHATMCQRCSAPSTSSSSCCQDRLERVNSCESGSSSSSCERTRCSSYPESFSTGEPTAYGLRHSSNQHSSTDTEELHRGAPRGQALPAGAEPVEREIAMRLRRIGDQMNEHYLQRRQVGQRQWWGPLRWHLTQMISEILAALYNPLVDILPQN